MNIITAFWLSPVWGLVHTFSVRQSSLVGMPGFVREARNLRPASVIPYFSISSWGKSASKALRLEGMQAGPWEWSGKEYHRRNAGTQTHEVCTIDLVRPIILDRGLETKIPNRRLGVGYPEVLGDALSDRGSVSINGATSCLNCPSNRPVL